MIETLNQIAVYVSVAMVGFCLGAMMILSPVLRKRRVRAIAELRRQARSYEDKLQAQAALHGIEVAALKEGIRFERTKIRPHDAVARCNIRKTPLLNQSETRVFEKLEQLVSTFTNAERLFAQVALVEVFSARSMNGCKDTRRAAFEAYGNMRVDFLIVDRDGYPICGIEYQGTGHHQGNFAYREQIKREVFRRANVPLVEVGTDDPWPEIRATIKAALRAPLIAA